MVDKESAVPLNKRIGMANSADRFTITVPKRPWWMWVLSGLWLLAEILLVQTALASSREGEERAAAVSWIAVAVLAAVGMLVRLCRRRLGSSERGIHRF